MSKTLQIFIILLFLTSVASADIIDCDNCTDCTSKIQSANTGDIIRLTANISDCDDTCITFDQPGGVTFDGMGYTISGIGERGVQGILLPKYADNCTIRNVTITHFDDGMYLYEASYTLIQNVTAHDNDDCGIDIIYGTGNEIRDCSLPENGYFDFYFRPHPIDDCNMTLTNVMGTNGLPIGYYTENVTLTDTEFAVLILCGADGSTLDNITITGSSLHSNNGMKIYGTDNATLTDIKSSDNFCGISLEESSNNTIKDVICERSWHYNIYMRCGYGNWLENVTVSNSAQAGIYLNQAHNSVLTEIMTHHNPFGIKLDRSAYVVVNDSEITDNILAGISLAGTGSFDNLIYNNYFDNDNDVNTAIGYSNDWNVTNRSGLNIIGGQFIGGNHWARRTFVIDDDQDGFGDAPFFVDENNLNIDNLTLCYPGTPQMYIRNAGYDLGVGEAWEYLVTCQNASGYDVNCTGLSWHSSNETVGIISDVIGDGANFTALAIGQTSITVAGFCGLTDIVLQNVTAAGAICGDVDGNGHISANDFVETYYRAVDPDYPLVDEWAADADGNGCVSVNDVVEIYLAVVDPAHHLSCVLEDSYT